MFINQAVREEKFSRAKYPCFGWNTQGRVEITAICATAEEASSTAQRMLKKHHARKTLVCRWVSREEIIQNLEVQVQQLEERDRKFNSPQSGSDAHELKGIIKELKRAIK